MDSWDILLLALNTMQSVKEVPKQFGRVSFSGAWHGSQVLPCAGKEGCTVWYIARTGMMRGPETSPVPTAEVPAKPGEKETQGMGSVCHIRRLVLHLSLHIQRDW